MAEVPVMSIPFTARASSIDSLTAADALIERARTEVSNHSRVLIANQIAAVTDDNIKQRRPTMTMTRNNITTTSVVAQHNALTSSSTSAQCTHMLASSLSVSLVSTGLSVLLSWLDAHSSPSAVIQSALDALANLDISAQTLIANSAILIALKPLTTHADESVRGTADDLYSCYQHMQNEESVEEDDEESSKDGGSKFSQIKIDKEMPHVAVATPTVSAVLSTPETVENVRPHSETIDMAAVEVVEFDALPFKPRRKSRGLSVRWAPDESINQIRVFHHNEIILKTANPYDNEHTSSTASKYDKSEALRWLQTQRHSKGQWSVQWRTPPRLILPDPIQAQLNARGKDSLEKITQAERERQVAPVIYAKAEDIPPDPLPSNEAAVEANDRQVPLISFVSVVAPPPQPPSISPHLLPPPPPPPPQPPSASNASLLKQLTSIASLLPHPQSAPAPAPLPSLPPPPPPPPVPASLSRFIPALPQLPQPPPPPPSLFSAPAPAPPANNLSALLATLKAVANGTPNRPPLIPPAAPSPYYSLPPPPTAPQQPPSMAFNTFQHAPPPPLQQNFYPQQPQPQSQLPPPPPPTNMYSAFGQATYSQQSFSTFPVLPTPPPPPAALSVGNSASTIDGQRKRRREEISPINGQRKVCAYYNTPAGCKLGSKCTFAHEDDQQANVLNGWNSTAART